MALRIGAATKTTPESWLNMQMYFDLWQTRKMKKKLKVKSSTRPEIVFYLTPGGVLQRRGFFSVVQCMGLCHWSGTLQKSHST
jgi:hypothetical protein